MRIIASKSLYVYNSSVHITYRYYLPWSYLSCNRISCTYSFLSQYVDPSSFIYQNNYSGLVTLGVLVETCSLLLGIYTWVTAVKLCKQEFSLNEAIIINKYSKEKERGLCLEQILNHKADLFSIPPVAKWVTIT